MNDLERSADLNLLVKVPVIITIYFWVIKIRATTVGETAADYLIGDYLSQPLSNGGLCLGTVVTSAWSLAAILLLVAFLTISRVDASRLEAEPLPIVADEEI
jgi:uncharacterized membrane-anchored protein